MRKFLIGLALIVGMLAATVMMAAAPAQAYMAPPQGTTTVVKYHRVVGLHDAHQVKKCYVRTNRLTGEATVLWCTHWRTVSYGSFTLVR